MASHKPVLWPDGCWASGRRMRAALAVRDSAAGTSLCLASFCFAAEPGTWAQFLSFVCFKPETAVCESGLGRVGEGGALGAPC